MANKDGRPPVENPKQSVLGVRVTLEDHERIKTNRNIYITISISSLCSVMKCTQTSMTTLD